jgi:hypothetical protein
MNKKYFLILLCNSILSPNTPTQQTIEDFSIRVFGINPEQVTQADIATAENTLNNMSKPVEFKPLLPMPKRTPKATVTAMEQHTSTPTESVDINALQAFATAVYGTDDISQITAEQLAASAAAFDRQSVPVPKAIPMPKRTQKATEDSVSPISQPKDPQSTKTQSVTPSRSQAACAEEDFISTKTKALKELETKLSIRKREKKH